MKKVIHSTGTWPGRTDDGYSYCISEISDTRLGGQRIFEVWGRNAKTGYRWLIAECNSREEARAVVRRRREQEDK
jgi:hypothetical protein